MTGRRLGNRQLIRVAGGGLFSTFDCAVKGVRKKEDPYNAISQSNNGQHGARLCPSDVGTILTLDLVAGFFTGGALAIRGGYKAARNGAIGCAVLLAGLLLPVLRRNCRGTADAGRSHRGCRHRLPENVCWRDKVGGKMLLAAQLSSWTLY